MNFFLLKGLAIGQFLAVGSRARRLSDEDIFWIEATQEVKGDKAWDEMESCADSGGIDRITMETYRGSGDSDYIRLLLHCHDNQVKYLGATGSASRVKSDGPLECENDAPIEGIALKRYRNEGGDYDLFRLGIKCDDEWTFTVSPGYDYKGQGVATAPVENMHLVAVKMRRYREGGGDWDTYLLTGGFAHIPTPIPTRSPNASPKFTSFTGYWNPIEYTVNGIEYEWSDVVAYTTTQENSAGWSKETTNQVGVAVSAEGGLKFLSSVKVEASYSWSQSVQSFATQTILETATGSKTEEKTIAVLPGQVWQFVFDSDNGEHRFATKNIVTTVGRHEPPCCLPGYALEILEQHGACASDTPCFCEEDVCFPSPTEAPMRLPLKSVPSEVSEIASPTSSPNSPTIAQVNANAFTNVGHDSPTLSPNSDVFAQTDAAVINTAASSVSAANEPRKPKNTRSNLLILFSAAVAISNMLF